MTHVLRTVRHVSKFDGPGGLPEDAPAPVVPEPPQFVGKQRSPLRTALVVVGVILGLAVIGWLMRVASDGAKAEQAATAAESAEAEQAAAAEEIDDPLERAAPAAATGPAPAYDGKWTTIAGKLGKGNRVSVTYASEVDQYGDVPLTVEGRLDDPGQLGSGIVSVMALRRGSCPSVAPDDDGDANDELLGLNVFQPGPFRSGARAGILGDPGTVAVCAYATSSATDDHRLVAGGKLRIAETLSPQSAADAAYVQPGVYAAEGDAVVGGAKGAKVEFEVRDTPGDEARKLAYIAVDGLKDGGCGAPKQAYTQNDLDTGDVYDTISLLGLDSGVSLTGGSAKPGEFRGQVYVTAGTCGAMVAFTARRVAGAKRALQQELG